MTLIPNHDDLRGFRGWCVKNVSISLHVGVLVCSLTTTFVNAHFSNTSKLADIAKNQEETNRQLVDFAGWRLRVNQRLDSEYVRKDDYAREMNNLNAGQQQIFNLLVVMQSGRTVYVPAPTRLP